MGSKTPYMEAWVTIQSLKELVQSTYALQRAVGGDDLEIPLLERDFSVLSFVLWILEF